MVFPGQGLIDQLNDAMDDPMRNSPLLYLSMT